MANTCEVAITSLLATLGFVQEAFRSKVVELESSDAGAEASWELQVSETKPPDALSRAERRELLHPDGVESGLFVWGYVDSYVEGQSGVAWHLDLRRHGSNGWAIDRMLTVDDRGRELAAQVCADSAELARALPDLVRELLAEEP